MGRIRQMIKVNGQTGETEHAHYPEELVEF